MACTLHKRWGGRFTRGMGEERIFREDHCRTVSLASPILVSAQCLLFTIFGLIFACKVKTGRIRANDAGISFFSCGRITQDLHGQHINAHSQPGSQINGFVIPDLAVTLTGANQGEISIYIQLISGVCRDTDLQLFWETV